jgi:hypothetical protein
MGYDSIEAATLEAAIAELAKPAIEHKLILNTPDGIFAGGERDRKDPDFVAYHRLWVLLPATKGTPISIAVLMLKEYRARRAHASHKGTNVDVAYKWIAEESGPAVMDACIVDWFERAPVPTAFPWPGAPEWRYEVRRLARLAEQREARKTRRKKPTNSPVLCDCLAATPQRCRRKAAWIATCPDVDAGENPVVACDVHAAELRGPEEIPHWIWRAL